VRLADLLKIVLNADGNGLLPAYSRTI